MARLRHWSGLGSIAKIVGLSFLAGIAGQLHAHGWRETVGIAVVFGFPTALLVFGTRGVDLDKAAGRVVEWWGLGLPNLFGLPFWRRIRPLAPYVEVSFADRRSGGSDDTRGATVYPVWLSGPQAPSIELTRRWTYVLARRSAERVASYLGVTLADTVGSNQTRRPAEALDRVLVKAPPRETTEILLRERRYFSTLGIWTLPVAAGVGLWTLFLQWKPDGDLVVVVVALAVGAVVAGCAGLNRVLKPALRERVIVSPAGLRLERRYVLARRTREIAWSALEELDVAWPRLWRAPLDLDGRKVVCARSDRKLVEFGFGLSDAELELLRTRILETIPKEMP